MSDHTIKDFHEGQRVKAHPATDTFMRGDVYGTVRKVGRNLVHVDMDRSGRKVSFSPCNLLYADE